MCSSLGRYALCAGLIGGLLVPAWSQRKKKKTEEEMTQVLEVPKDPPAAVVAETAKLGFAVSPLSNKGLLSQQTRDALKALDRATRGNPVVKLRAFVAGTGDLRRVPQIVSEIYTDRKKAIPAVSVVQVGALPMEGAQIQFEAIYTDKKAVNPNGLGFLSGQLVTDETAPGRMANLVEESVRRLERAAGDGEMLRATCFVSHLDQAAAFEQRMRQSFPQAALVVLQLRRAPGGPLVECEGVARLKQAPAAAVELRNPEGLDKSANYSQVAAVNAPRVVFTGLQMAFGFEAPAVKTALERLRKVLESQGSSSGEIFFTQGYPVANRMMDAYRQVRFEVLDKTKPPASTLLVFEGLPSSEAGFGMEVAASLSR
jgi:enamine deaminase RidA (YjgF/YER057c/UK114 family)